MGGLRYDVQNRLPDRDRLLARFLMQQGSTGRGVDMAWHRMLMPRGFYDVRKMQGGLHG